MKRFVNESTCNVTSEEEIRDIRVEERKQMITKIGLT
jgi:hypothetical protein